MTLDMNDDPELDKIIFTESDLDGTESCRMLDGINFFPWGHIKDYGIDPS